MADQPLTFETLVQFHRQVVVPDIERIVDQVLADARATPAIAANS